jgi:hypothetical protein
MPVDDETTLPACLPARQRLALPAMALGVMCGAALMAALWWVL